MTNVEFSFERGFGKVPNESVRAVRADIMRALNIRNRGTWLRRLRGEVEPKITECAAIEEVFNRYGISQIWGKN